MGLPGFMCSLPVSLNLSRHPLRQFHDVDSKPDSRIATLPAPDGCAAPCPGRHPRKRGPCSALRIAARSIHAIALFVIHDNVSCDM